MRNEKPSPQVIEFFEKLGYDYKVVNDSVYMDKRDVPLHYFQTKGADGVQFVSTIMAEHGTDIWRQAIIGESLGRRCPHCNKLLELPARKPYKKRSLLNNVSEKL